MKKRVVQRRIKGSLHMLHRVKGRPRSLVFGAVLLNGSLVADHVEKRREKWGKESLRVVGEEGGLDHSAVRSVFCFNWRN